MAGSRFRLKGAPLPFRVFDKIQTVTPAAIVGNKRLGAALAMVNIRRPTHRTCVVTKGRHHMPPLERKASSFQFPDNGLDRAWPGMPVVSKENTRDPFGTRAKRAMGAAYRAPAVARRTVRPGWRACLQQSGDNHRRSDHSRPDRRQHALTVVEQVHAHDAPGQQTIRPPPAGRRARPV